MKPNSKKGQVVNKFKTSDSSNILLLLKIMFFFGWGREALRVVEAYKN